MAGFYHENRNAGEKGSVPNLLNCLLQPYKTGVFTHRVHKFVTLPGKVPSPNTSHRSPNFDETQKKGYNGKCHDRPQHVHR